MWILLSLAGAFCQALGMAVTKKVLKIEGIRNFIAAITFLLGGFFLILFYFWEGKSIWPENGLSLVFWHWMFWTVFLNVVSVYFLYKALKLAELSYLMPFMTLTSLSIIIPPIILLGEVPSVQGLIGIGIVAVGAILIDYKGKKKDSSSELEELNKNNQLGKLYFLGTAFCYTISPTTTKLAIIESSGLFAALSMLVMLGIIFLIFVFLFKENKKIIKTFYELDNQKITKFIVALLLLGLTAAISNWAINVAMESAKVSYVMAIKRVMPLFAFLIGYFYFGERSDLVRKLVATFLMVSGAVLTTLSS